MKLFNKIAVVGVGLIGGSIALAIKKRNLAGQVVGVSRHKKTLLLAKKAKAIDSGSQDLNIIKDADLVILAAPVQTIINLAPRISKIIKKGCIVTDVGSTKEEIVRALEKSFSLYVGSHPLAGSEKRGIAHAQRDLFSGSLCILTPTSKTNKQAVDKVRRLWVGLGARTASLNPSLHDKVLSFVSHLPHVAGFSLIAAVPALYLKFASTGLKDTTRVAGSESEIWADILLTNRKNIISSVEKFQKSLSRIKLALENRDSVSLNKILKDAKNKRDKLA